MPHIQNGAALDGFAALPKKGWFAAPCRTCAALRKEQVRQSYFVLLGGLGVLTAGHQERTLFALLVRAHVDVGLIRWMTVLKTASPRAAWRAIGE